MSEALGKIEKPAAEDFKKGRKLYLVPLIFQGRNPEPEYIEKFEKFWSQVEIQISDLELKLGDVNRVYHELISLSGESGVKTIKELNEKSCQVVEKRLAKGAQLEAAEETEILTEFMDWSRCLAVGLENQKVFVTVYESYKEVSKKRNEYISKHIDETLKADEIGVLFIREGHQIQFPSDIQVIYVSPPALDEIERWLRDRHEHEAEPHKD
jgi:hypothetical protein